MGSPAKRVQLHHRALGQLQDVLDRHLGAPQLHRQLHGNIEHHVDVIARAHRYQRAAG